MGHLSETDEDYKKKKRALEAVINELQSAADGEAQPVSSAHALTQSSRKERSVSVSRSRSKSSSRPAHCE
jgi:hypothetical protein